MNSQQPFALVLLSGGLDSILAARLLQEQGIAVEGVGFQTPFFDCEKGRQAALKMNIPFHVIDFSEPHFEKVKHPHYPSGKGANPCIDCHALMIAQTFSLLQKMNKKKGFIATGEVLGQRPLSQNKQALRLVAKAADLPQPLLVRPLSAQLLDPTLPEEEGWVDRAQLLDISGRGRARQLELAAHLGIDYFAPPAGGCVLTEKNFGQLLHRLLEYFPEVDAQTAGLLRFGRPYFFEDALVILGRTQDENAQLYSLARSDDLLLKLQDLPGPHALLRPFTKGDKSAILNEIKQEIYTRSKKASGQPFETCEFLLQLK